MDLRHVRFAIAVSEELQFTAAARRCGVSQPSLTVAIRALEDELGRPLFERRPEVRVTDFGQRVLAQMYVISDACDAISAMAVEAAKRSPIPDEQAKVAQSRPGVAG
jgi:LysR family transcriptional regulator, hydrogen peroxide-inducible genes activator